MYKHIGMTNVKNKPGKSFNVHQDLYEDSATCTSFLSRKMTIRRNTDEVA